MISPIAGIIIVCTADHSARVMAHFHVPPCISAPCRSFFLEPPESQIKLTGMMVLFPKRNGLFYP
jgi:hypothetical protein